MFDNQNKLKSSKEQYHYFKATYDHKGRFCSYWHQINEILQLNPTKVLEVGIGNGFVTRYLREKEVNVTTLDIVHVLQPDVVGSVLAIPFETASFDVIACYEILEHLPYNDFAKALRELARVSQKHVILTLPEVTTAYRFNIELPRIKPIKKLIARPFARPAHHKFDGEHYWEIGKKYYPLKKIEFDLKRIFKIIKTYRVFEYLYHRFFQLEKF